MSEPDRPAPESPTPVRGTPPTAAPRGLAPGQFLGDRYEIRARLGAGGMGEVWLAHDLKLRVEVALKSVRPEFLGSDKRRELLRREVRAAREVVSPNVCRVFDLVAEGGLELVSMEFVDGRTLADLLRERAPLPVGEARELAAQLLAGLEAVHEAGLVHRDLKPENVMITRTGRVVVMDLGLARPATSGAGSVAGTPAYMAPEQSRGGPVDARTDVFAAGVVLAEMVAPAGIRDREQRLTLWEGIRKEPPRVPEGPWADVLAKAVSASPEGRYGSARELSRALERVTVHAERGDDAQPYPGLSAFTARDRERFFGREAEVEQLLRKLGRARLLAIAGPSGAGKTSFLQAGLVPALPEGWRHAILHPGDRPFAALVQALLPELAGDTEALRALVQTEDLGALLSALGRWRRRHGQVVLIADQLEELFTLNPAETQARFTELLGRLPVEADVHVLLSLRDDFLFRCHEHEALAPAFAELTPLGPPTGPALRRALVQPAVAEGYRFEDDALVEAMLGEVEHERGALPLLAFAAARLWETRDRERGLLTRAAYEEIGGVGGALAHHADATLERIGTARTPLARELLRNLVTAEGTRASRLREELLSVFDASQAEGAGEVLDALVNARLLTSYEVAGHDGRDGGSRIEVVHESLLTAWPRLVHWRTQDAEGAQLRDQLRQAAQLWEERSRPDDLLWTGSSYREYALWRDRYPGNLSAVEEAFARAMRGRASRARRIRGLAAISALTVVSLVALALGVLWRGSEHARRAAEAAELLSLGHLRIEGNPSAALAHAIASLEKADSDAARRFSLRALWSGSLAHAVTGASKPCYPLWSPDGRWLAAGGTVGVLLLERDTGASRTWGDSAILPRGFSRDASRLLTAAPHGDFQLWTLPGFELDRTLTRESGVREAWLVDRGLLTAEADPSDEQTRPPFLRLRPVDGGPAVTVGRWSGTGQIDGRGRFAVSMKEGRLLLRPLAGPAGAPRAIGRHDGDVRLTIGPSSRYLVTGDDQGEIRLWNAGTGELERTLQSPAPARATRLDASGRYLAAAPALEEALPPRSLFVFDLAAPKGAEPLALLNDEIGFLNAMDLHPNGRWLASGHFPHGTLIWNLASPRPLVFRSRGPLSGVAFTPDGRLITNSEAVVTLWPLWADIEAEPRELFSPPGKSRSGLGLNSPVVSTDGRFAVVVERWAGEVIVLSLEDSTRRVHEMFESEEEAAKGEIDHPALSPDGRWVAVGFGGFGIPQAASIRLLDLETGHVRELLPESTTGACVVNSPGLGLVQRPSWLPDGRLISEGALGLRLWSLEDGSSQQLRRCRDVQTAVKVVASASGKVVTLHDPASVPGVASMLQVYDLEDRTSREVTTHGRRLTCFAMDQGGSILVTGDADGLVQVGPLAGGEPHLLYGHTRAIRSVAISPDRRWIASTDDATIRLWPVPDLGAPPLHALPLHELLRKLRGFTNLRVVPYPGSTTGYRVEPEPFPGWKDLPTW